MSRFNSFNAGATATGVTEVTGSVEVTNLPVTQSVLVVNDSLDVNVSGTLSASIDNFPAVQEITGSAFVYGDFYQAVQPVTGVIEVTNLPAVQEITGSALVYGDFYPTVTEITGVVTVGNFPNTQSVIFDQPISVTGDFYQVEQPVSVSNLHAIQDVTGVVGITSIASPILIGNYPVTQAVRLVDEPIEVFFDQPTIVTGVVDIVNPVAVTGDFFQTTQPVSFDQPIEVIGTASVEVSNFPVTSSVVFPLAPTANLSSYTASTVSVELVAANPNRKALSFYISSSSDVEPVCYIAFGDNVASTINASFILYGNDYFETPGPFLTPAVQAVFNMTTGSVRVYVTELEG